MAEQRTVKVRLRGGKPTPAQMAAWRAFVAWMFAPEPLDVDNGASTISGNTTAREDQA